MACFQLPSKSDNDRWKWYFDDYKLVKIFGKDHRITFQRKGKYTRGITISKEAFKKMMDVSITPTAQLELEKNVFLKNLGNRIQLIKYCLTRDAKRCEGGFFYFTNKEWQQFVLKLRPQILEALQT